MERICSNSFVAHSTLIKVIVPETMYPTKSWVIFDLQPILHTVASNLEDMLKTDDVNSGEDYATRATTTQLWQQRSKFLELGSPTV